MSFSTENSARKIVQDKPNWKSRPLDLGNRHRTTLNFGDLVPAFWSHVQPGDKLKMDATILAKFMPLIVPAFSRMKIKSEWFFVPLRQISPPSLRALQDFKPSDASTVFSQVLQRGSFPYSADRGENQQVIDDAGFPSIPAWWISSFFAADTVTRLSDSGDFINGAYRFSFWRTKGDVSASDYSNLGYEDFVSYATKFRCAKLASYMGLPVRLSTLRYMEDVYGNYYGGTIVPLAAKVDNFDSDSYDIMSPYYRMQVFQRNGLVIPEDGVVNIDRWNAGFFERNWDVTNASATTVQFPNLWRGITVPYPSTGSAALISLLPFMSYQKIYNDFYRDEKLQVDEIRTFPLSYWDSSLRSLMTGPSDEYLRFSATNWRYFLSDLSYNVGSLRGYMPRLFNNLFGLRRRNRAKDVLSSCVTDKVLVNRLADSSTAPNVFQSNLFSKVEKYLMKKEFTGSTWAEWLSNFFGVNSNDLLNNQVIFLGAKESVVSISENIQTSSSVESVDGKGGSAQGNRAGLAGDFHNGESIYFRVPDFGVVMCIVSVIPDDVDNFNGLAERFSRESPYQFNLPDLQNIGYSPVFNRRANIGFYDKPFVTRQYDDEGWFGDDVFGYQPFGYSHTYNPNVISGDFTKSLRFWHQSPDLDYDFSGGYLSPLNTIERWSSVQLRLNANLPVIGLRLQPLGHGLRNQYYNNIFAQTNDESGDHIVADMRFFVTCHRNTAFFTDAIEDEK